MVKPGNRREMAHCLHAEHRVSKRRAAHRPRWGLGLMFDWTRLHEHKWSHKRVYRIYKELELNLRIKPKNVYAQGIPCH